MENLTWHGVLPPVKLDVINKIEKKLKIKFPEDYIVCVIENHGGYPSSSHLDFGGMKEKEFRSLLALVPKTVSQTKKPFILDVYECIMDRLPAKVFPFANQSGGDYYCFDYRKTKNPTIVYWDHEKAFSDPKYCIIDVAPTFTTMLKMLYNA